MKKKPEASCPSPSPGHSLDSLPSTGGLGLPLAFCNFLLTHLSSPGHWAPVQSEKGLQKASPHYLQLPPQGPALTQYWRMARKEKAILPILSWRERKNDSTRWKSCFFLILGFVVRLVEQMATSFRPFK